MTGIEDRSLLIQAVAHKVNDYLKLGTPITVAECLKLLTLCTLDEGDRDKEDIYRTLEWHRRHDRSLTMELADTIRIFIERAWARRLRDLTQGQGDIEALRAWLFPSEMHSSWVMYRPAYLFRSAMFEGTVTLVTGKVAKRGIGKSDTAWYISETVLETKAQHLSLREQGREKASDLWQIYKLANPGTGTAGGAGEREPGDRIPSGMLECDGVQILTNSQSLVQPGHRYYPAIKVEPRLSDLLLDGLEPQLKPGGMFSVGKIDEAHLVNPNMRQGSESGWQTGALLTVLRKINMSSIWISLDPKGVPESMRTDSDLLVEKRTKYVAQITTGDLRRVLIEPVQGTTLAFDSQAPAMMVMDVDLLKIVAEADSISAEARKYAEPLSGRDRVRTLIGIIKEARKPMQEILKPDSPGIVDRVRRLLEFRDPTTKRARTVDDLHRIAPFDQASIEKLRELAEAARNMAAEDREREKRGRPGQPDTEIE